MDGKSDEDIWQAFERVLAEHGHVEQETPEEAAKARAVRQGRLIDIGYDVLIERLGGSGIEDFLAGVQWARNNPAALVNWRRYGCKGD